MSRALIELRHARRLPRTGGKARSLARLQAMGLSVPRAWVVPPRQVRMLRSDPNQHASAILETLDTDCTYAVRSSADAEDQKQHSFAGRFHTMLRVSVHDVARAIADVGTIADGDPAHLYADALGAPVPPPEIGVIVQKMIEPHAAGVVFSRNPVTGIKETVIEAVKGSAEDLMSGVERPERWVRKRGEWLLTPDAPVLPAEVASRIADEAERLEKAFGHSIDAEWAWDGTLWWLQARPMTVGVRAGVYSSKLARDMLPGIILPLVWSVNGPFKSTAFVRFLEDVFGPLGVRPSELSALFHYRMYINIGALSSLFAEFGLPEESLELLAGMERGAGMPKMPRPTMRSVARVPHLVHALSRFSRFDRELDRVMPELWRQSREFAASVDPNARDADELLSRVDRLQQIMSETSYCHLVTLMIMQMHTMRLRARLESSGVVKRGETLQLPCAEADDDDVGRALAELAASARELPAEMRALVAEQDLDGLRQLPQASVFLADFDRFVERFGHLSDSGVNLASVPWAEQPACILGMVASQLEVADRRQAGQTREEFEREHALGRRDARALRRALKYQCYRGRTSALYTYTYGQFRPLVLGLGRHLLALGALDTNDGIFYLSLEEIQRVVNGALSPSDARALVEARREEVEIASGGEPPEVVVGEVAELVKMPHRRTLRGTPSSRGRYTGRVVVCRSIGDLSRIGSGDVVVVPFSDASWTPLFTHAGAIVAESGGVLSHSAILARELGVPAVVSVRGALALAEGSLVSVDGFDGTVTVISMAS